MSGNDASGNIVAGIYLLSSSDNIVTGNNASRNGEIGIWLSFSPWSYTSNVIYHNNFFNNSLRQVESDGPDPNFWDNGYPSGGNYWSDYSGADLYNGVSQNITGSDGVGDTPYSIEPANVTDNYPLMKPYVPFENQTIYIRADGSVDPSGAPILRKGDRYTLTDNVTSNADAIVIERDNVVLDGAGFKVQGSGTGNGIDLSNRSNVTIENTNIQNCGNGISLMSSTDNNIFGNNISNNWMGIWLYHYSSGNDISGNHIAANGMDGIWLNYSCSNNIFSGNDIAANNADGIFLAGESGNSSISGNNLTNNGEGIRLFESANIRIYHNNFVNNNVQVYPHGSGNSWDDNYPSSGNYWSNYNGTDVFDGVYQNETGSDGIGDTPCVIDGSNKDNYPLMKPYPWDAHDVGVTSVAASKNVVGQELCLSVSVMMFNYGNDTETLNATIYANQTVISETSDIELTSRNFTVISFTWNTTGVTLGNYTLSAYARPVPGEIDTADNNLTGGQVTVSLVGDVTGPNGWPDGKVDMRDIGLVARHFGETVPPAPANCDLTGTTAGVPDGVIDMRDIGLIARHFME